VGGGEALGQAPVPAPGVGRPGCPGDDLTGADDHGRDPGPGDRGVEHLPAQALMARMPGFVAGRADATAVVYERSDSAG